MLSPPERPEHIDDAALHGLEDTELEGSALDEYKNRKLAAAAAADAAREKRLQIVLWVIFLLVLSAIAYGAVQHIKQIQLSEKRAREALFALQSRIAAADDTYAKLHIVATNIVSLEISARNIGDKAAAQPEQPTGPEIKTAARKVAAELDKIREKVQLARQTDAAALTLKNETVKATSVIQAKSGVDKLSELLASLTIAGNEARQTLVKAEQDVADIMAIKAKMDKERKDTEEKEIMEKKEKAEAQLAEEHKALIQGELQSVDSATNSVQPLIAQYKYQEAAAELANRSFNYKTDEGKKALKIAIEKCNRLQSLKLFVIERLNADQYPWGYYDTDTRSQVDVTGADEKEVKVRTKTVAWSAINTAQMLKFIDRALSNEKAPIQTQAGQNFAAAIFSVMNGSEKAAKTYLIKALTLMPTLKNDADQLLPNLQ